MHRKIVVDLVVTIVTLVLARLPRQSSQFQLLNITSSVISHGTYIQAYLSVTRDIFSLCCPEGFLPSNRD